MNKLCVRMAILALVLPLPTTALAVAIGWTEHVVDLSYHHDPIDIELLDMDDDGDTDLVTGATFFGSGALAWWENDGSESFTEHVLTNSGNFWIVRPVDIDDDDDGDIVVSRGGVVGGEGQDYRLTFYENDGAGNFTESDLLTDLSNFHLINEPVDFDGDNDVDIFVGSRIPELSWLENTGGAPTTWPKHVINNTAPELAVLSRGVTIDYDDDNDLDIVTFHGGGAVTAPTLYLWENDGSENFTLQLPALHVLPAAAQPAANGLDASDIDDDGDTDLLVHYYLQWQVSGSVSWLENDGADNFTEHALTTTVEGGEVFAVDLDADGDEDVVAGVYRFPGWVKWFENDGSENFTEHTLAATQMSFNGVNIAIGDIDGDGALDIAQNAFFHDDIGWWESDLDLPAIPMASRWGLVGVALLLLVALPLIAIRRGRA